MRFNFNNGGRTRTHYEHPAPEAKPADIIQFAHNLGFIPDSNQEQILRSNHKRLLLNTTRQFGKSTTAAVAALYRTMQTPNTLVIVASPTERQSGELVLKAACFAAQLGIGPRGDGRNAISLKLPNGSRIVGLPGKEATIRGFSAPALVIVDEASRVANEVYEAVVPMLAASDGDLWVMSTPNGMQGFFYEEWIGTEPWARITITASQCPRISPDFLDEQRRRNEQMFRQEYCCEFIEIDGAVFNPEDIAAAFTSDVKPFDWEL